MLVLHIFIINKETGPAQHNLHVARGIIAMSTYIDLSHTLNASGSIYPGDCCFSSRSHLSIKGGDPCNVLTMEIGSHTGTHVDAPFHFFADGKTIDQIPLSSLVGPALVVDVSYKEPREQITWDDLESHAENMKPGIMLLLYTGWYKYWDQPQYIDHPYLARDAAEKILATGITFLGVDTFSPDETGGGSSDFGVHEVFLGAGALIAENLNDIELLKDGDEWTVSMVPLRLGEGDGAPVRAFAWKTS